MADSPLPDFLIVGPQKCATTWAYKCLCDHPEVYMPDTDSVHFFDMNYHEGINWYQDFFDLDKGAIAVGEETPSYIRDHSVPSRISEHLPDVKLIFMIRNPVDRAFSHYWHEKSKEKISFNFEEIFKNYDLYQNWVVPGLYHRHISRFEEHFPSDNIKLAFFEDLIKDDRAFIQDIYEFVGVDSDYVPKYVDQKVNESRYKTGELYQEIMATLAETLPEGVLRVVRPAHQMFEQLMFTKSEYEKGMPEKTRRRLESHFVEDAKDLQEYSGRTLESWFSHKDI